MTALRQEVVTSIREQQTPKESTYNLREVERLRRERNERILAMGFDPDTLLLDRRGQRLISRPQRIVETALSSSSRPARP